MRWLVGIAAIGICACDATSSPAPIASAAIPSASAAAPRYPSTAWANIRNDERSAPAQGGVVVVTRTLIGKITPVDGLALAVRFEGEAGVFAPDDPLGAQVLDWSRTLATAAFEVTSPDGSKQQLKLTEPPKHDDKAALSARPHVLQIEPLGLRLFAGVTAWTTPVPKLFANPGTYRLRVTGTLAVADDPIPFSTSEHSFEVVAMGREHLPLVDLSGIASRFVQRVEGLDAPPKEFGPALADVDDNVVFRFRAAGHTIDLAMTPKGALLGAHRTTPPPAPPNDPWQSLLTRPPP